VRGSLGFFFRLEETSDVHSHEDSMKTYQTGVVVGLTGLSAPTLQRLLQRNHIVLQPCDVPSRGCGENRGYSLRRITQIALTGELTQIGIAPSRASRASFEFSDKGSLGRPVGQLFPRATTYLVGLPGGENRVIGVPPDLSISDVLSCDSAAFIINVNRVIERITEKLETT
jgi:hypothetical protein